MSLESGKKSAAEMRAAQREKISQAEAATPAVVVTEKNWAAMIDSQKTQVKTLGEILEKLDTLTTQTQLVDYMNQQIQILQEDGKAGAKALEQYRQTLSQEVKNTTGKMQELVTAMEKQAGKMNEEFGSAISQEQEQMKNTSKKLFWISMLPHRDLGSLGTDTAYLAADLTNIIDRRPVEDCTTRHFRSDRKNRHGQTMGGM